MPSSSSDREEKSKNLKALVLSVAAILALFGAVAGGFYFWRALKEKKEKARLFALENKFIFVYENGIALDKPGNIRPLGEVLQSLDNAAEQAGFSDPALRHTKLKLHIRIDPEMRYHYLDRVIDSLMRKRITKIYIYETKDSRPVFVDLLDSLASGIRPDNRHPGLANIGPMDVPLDMLVEFWWCKKGKTKHHGFRKRGDDFKQYLKKVENGHMGLYVDNDFIETEAGTPAFGKLRDCLVKSMKEFKPQAGRPDAVMPVAIYSDGAAPVKHFLSAIRMFNILGIKNIVIASRYDLYPPY
jgi:hypothetical protein